ncbi:hypothetical protein O6H91_20G015500 [Diphasiastrum complanatum]|uniref:Uncharacterized protein n=2 Tax=Diphasiastrum complanatum TaxID=34168 RepID=A0ACC2AMZ0_DIPCM|nr:hypothetical protein O6H91_20G015500 [Diphasiastrum complanatum]KAJ7518929.1 hypothetical protein O6H91_20G015500 [Diphasiastrum complanatum]
MALAALRRPWVWYQTQIASHPLRTQIIMSGILWGTGDMIAQRINTSMTRRGSDFEAPEALLIHDSRQSKTVKNIPLANHDWKRTATCSFFGMGFVGPVGHFWYENLDSFVKNQLRLQPNSLQFILAKTIPDTIIFGPLHLITFFTLMGLAAGKPINKVKDDVKRDFIPTFVTEGLMWPIIQAINFRYVPVRHQLLFVNSLSLFDSAFLSWFNKEEDAPWKTKLLSLILFEKKSDDV